MIKTIKRQLNANDIAKLASVYLNEGRLQESWEISNVEIVGNTLNAQIKMLSIYVSPTDSGGFHLTIFPTLEFLSQLTIIYAHAWAGYSEKTREGWMIESSIISKRAIRDPENINVCMEVSSIKRIKNNILAVTRSIVSDSNGLFEATLKGFLS